MWAEKKGYTFVNPGCEGGDANAGNNSTPTLRKYEPITDNNWRCYIVWCNALSQKKGLKPCYYIDSGFTTPIKISTNNSAINTASGSEDNPYVDWNADGFRLPTEAEWEYAARGGQPGIINISWSFSYSGSNTLDDVAWHLGNAANRTHTVGTKQPNALGIFDMSGNVWEWCWDWNGAIGTSAETDPRGPSSGTNRIIKGGGWDLFSNYCLIGSRTMNFDTPYVLYNFDGIRVVCR